MHHQSMKRMLYRYRAVILLAILAFAFFTRMYQLHQPSGYMFDEVYHAVTSKLISRNDPRAYEWWNPAPEPNTAVDWLHPPLAKYTQAVSIMAFGENSFGWRFSSALFGVLVILMVYHLAYKLFKDHRVALLSAGIASLDGLLLVLSRIAMNDIHVTFFILWTLYNYLEFRENRKFTRLLLTGVSAGLALASKWSGLFVLTTILFFEGLRLLVVVFNKLADRKPNWKAILGFSARFVITRLFLLVLLPVVIYIGSYTHMFMQGKDWAHFKEMHNQIWWYQTTLKAEHPYQSRPLQWFFNLKPVWIHVEYMPDKKQRADVYAFGNPAIFWIGSLLVFFTAISVVTQSKDYFPNQPKSAKPTKRISLFLESFASNPILFVFISYCMVWLPWQLSPRIMFFYHYTPAVPLLTILIAYWLLEFKKWSNAFFYGALTLMIICFITWYPHWVGIPMPDRFVNSVYFALPQWK